MILSSHAASGALVANSAIMLDASFVQFVPSQIEQQLGGRVEGGKKGISPARDRTAVGRVKADYPNH